MYTRIQNLSIIILNSNYKFLFSLFIYFLIYFCFYCESNVALCMMKKESAESMQEFSDRLYKEIHKHDKELLEGGEKAHEAVLAIMEELKDWPENSGEIATTNIQDEFLDMQNFPIGIVEAEALPLAEVETTVRDLRAVALLREENRNLHFQLENALKENEITRKQIKTLEEKLQREIENRGDLATNMFIREKNQLLRRVQLAETKPLVEDKSTQAFSEQAIADAMLKSQPKRLRYLK